MSRRGKLRPVALLKRKAGVENAAASNLRCGERRTKAKNEGGKEAPNLHHESKPNNETPPEPLSFPSYYELWPAAYCGEAVWSLVGIRSWSEGYDVLYVRYLSEHLFSDAHTKYIESRGLLTCIFSNFRDRTGKWPLSFSF